MNAWWTLAQELSSPFTLVLAGILVGLAILLVVRHRRQDDTSPRRHRVAGAQTSRPFERGFDLLLDARWREAADILKAAVKTDPDRTLEYLELGKLFRRQEEPGRAARLFEQLGARPELDRGLRITAQYELALSYRALGWYESAAAALEQVLGADPSYAEARRELRRIHEDMGHWETAAALEMLRLKRGEAHDHHTLAALLTQQGRAAWMTGNLRHGAAHLQSALALDPDCTEAALYLGRILLRQGKLPQAFHIWEQLAKARPEFLFLAFRDMQTAFRQSANEARWESFLDTFTKQHPSDPMGYLALAEWYESRGQTEAAMRCLHQVLELDPVCQEAHLAMVSLYRVQGIPSEVLDRYERLARTTHPPGGRFRCRACGRVRENPFWKCPSCQGWATPERLIPQASAVPIMSGESSPPLSHADTGAPAPVAVTREMPVQPTPSA